MAEADGLTIVLSPVQLATVLAEGTIEPQHAARNRFFGALTVIGGAVELVGAAALLLAPEPTMTTKVAGGALALHGSDTAATGLRQLWSGQSESTLTAQAAEAAARSLGADPATAGTVGMTVDIVVPLAAGFVGALRAVAIRRGAVSLAAEEAAGGHTIARHVGRTEAQLRARLAQQGGIPAASSFRSLAEAERYVSAALRANRDAIRLWAASAGPNATRSFAYSARSLGYGVVRATGRLEDMHNMVIVLRKTQVGQKIYFVLTAYPKP